MIGSPSVFQTAPPQPASNARMTCSPLFAGGALASQNGFGLLMPANSMLRSAIFVSPSGGYFCDQRERRKRAALRPSATAFTTSLPPLMQSPPAKTFGFPVWQLAGSATTQPFESSSTPESSFASARSLD